MIQKSEEAEVRITISIPEPYDFEASLKTHGWFQLPPFTWREKEKTLYWAVRLGGGPTVLRLKAVSESPADVVLEVCGSSADDPQVVAKVRHVLNLDQPLDEFYTMCRRHPLLQQAVERSIGRIMRSENVYEDIMKGICGTNVQWNQAVKMITTLALLGDEAQVGFRLFPTPRQILDAGEAFLRETARVGYRSRYLIAAAERFLQEDPEEATARVLRMTADETRNYFRGFDGIGKVTARYLAALYGHFDELAVDSLVISYMSKHHFGGRIPSEKDIARVYDAFGDLRYLAYWMEFIVNEGWQPKLAE